MSDPLERVRALLARAADEGASEEEARTSAVLAARLMKKHGLKVNGGGSEPGPFSFHINTDGLWKEAARKYKADAEHWEQRARAAEARVNAAESNAETRSTFHETARPSKRGPRRPTD